MKIFLSSYSTTTLRAYRRIFPDARVNALRSFGGSEGDHGNFLKNRQFIDEVGLDSGAWTANRQGPDADFNINRETYADFLDMMAPHFDIYFNFDIDFSSNGFEQNLENQRYLERRGFHPVPVVHDLYGSEIAYYIDQGYPTVAIGSTQVQTVEDIIEPVNKLYEAGVKVFLCGTTRYSFLAQLPIWGADSSTWHQAGATGYILYWNHRSNRLDKTEQIHLAKGQGQTDNKTYLHDYEHRDEVLDYLQNTFGFDHYNLLGSDQYLNRQIVNVHHFVEMQRRVTADHKRLGFRVGD